VPTVTPPAPNFRPAARHAALTLAFAWLLCGPAAAGADGRIAVTPEGVALDGRGARQQLAVTLFAGDGSARDLTASARFAVEPAGLASVSPSGVVSPGGWDGCGVIWVEAGGKSASLPLRVERPTTDRPVGYRSDVAALLSKAGCNAGACHGNLNGKGGFRLSLRGEDPAFDLAMMARESLGRRVDRADPARSLVLVKPAGLVPHEGGQRFPPASPEAETLRRWVAAGAADDPADAPRLVRLGVAPEVRTLAAPGLAQQLVVTAEFSDGRRRDVTRQASYDVNDPTRASVTPDGLVRADRPTETVVAVRYLGGRGVSRLAFLPDRPDYRWQGPPPANAVDVAVFDKLRSLRMNPSPAAGDALFLRRATLDALGRLPTPEEVRAFLAEGGSDDEADPAGSSGRRARLVDRLVAATEFADFWALKWADLLRNEEKTMGAKGVWVFQRWLRDAFAADRPLDAFARDLLTAGGSTHANPPANFYRTNRDPNAAAETVAQVFLGVRMGCARCHNHPFDRWTQDDYYGLAAYFGNVRRKPMATGRSDNLDTHEVNGDEVIHVAGRPSAVQPRSGATLAPKPPGGPSPDLADGPDARDDLARWLTVGNRQFARNLANRVWFHLAGRGVVEPVDDFRESNPPSNPALLDALTDELIAGGYRLRPLVRLVMTSETYRRSSEPNATNADDEANFARSAVRPLPAEVLLDALGQALGRPGQFPGLPAGLRATQLAGARMGGPFLKAFGKPDRLLTCECERSESTTLAQAFQLINGDAVRAMLDDPDNRLGRLLAAGSADDAVLDDLVLAALGRAPTAAERAGFLAHVRHAGDRRKGWEDVAWAVVNSKEFLLRH